MLSFRCAMINFRTPFRMIPSGGYRIPACPSLKHADPLRAHGEICATDAGTHG